MVPRWTVVDKLVHELGSLRAVVDEVDADAEMADADVSLELRSSLARAADTVHLVIGGDDAMVEKAWRTIAEAQEVGARARAAIERARATRQDARVISDDVKGQGWPTARKPKALPTVGTASPARTPRKAGPGPARPRPR
jgi:hypothetical protein